MRTPHGLLRPFYLPYIMVALALGISCQTEPETGTPQPTSVSNQLDVEKTPSESPSVQVAIVYQDEYDVPALTPPVLTSPVLAPPALPEVRPVGPPPAPWAEVLPPPTGLGADPFDSPFPLFKAFRDYAVRFSMASAGIDPNTPEFPYLINYSQTLLPTRYTDSPVFMYSIPVHADAVFDDDNNGPLDFFRTFDDDE